MTTDEDEIAVLAEKCKSMLARQSDALVGLHIHTIDGALDLIETTKQRVRKGAPASEILDALLGIGVHLEESRARILQLTAPNEQTGASQ